MRRTALALALLGALLAAAPAAAAPFVYATDAGSNTVEPFDTAPGGTLTPLAPLAATGTAPQGVEVSPDGRSVYAVARLGRTISAWDVQLDGTLTAKTPATIASTSDEPVDIALTPDGRYAFVAGYSNNIDRYAVAADGDLTPLGSVTAPGGLETIAISPDGGSLYSTSLYDSAIGLWTIGADGSLTPKSTPTLTLSSAPRDVALSPDGTALYTAGSQVHQFRVTAGGLLEPRTPAALATTGTGFAIVIAPDGRTLYVPGQNGGASIVEPYAIRSDGTLEPLPDVAPAGVSSGLRYAAVAPDGDSLYVAAPGASGLLQFDRAADGALTPKTPASVTYGSPWDVDVRPEADLAVAVASAPAGSDEAAITATATNVRGMPTQATVTVPVPADMTFVAASSSAGTCTGTGPVVCRVGSLAEGRSATVTVRAQPTRTGAIPITASVAGVAPDPVAGNASDAGTATIVARPGATTAPASAITTTGATLTGVVVPSGPNTTYRFEYGRTAAYGSATPAVARTTAGLVTAQVTGLEPGTTYHVRLVATNESATVNGEDLTFTTATPPPPPEVITRTVTVPGPTVTVPGPPAPAPPAVRDRTAPKVSKVTLSRTRLGLATSEAARVRVTIELRRGRRWAKVRTVTLRTTKAGAARVKLSALRPGRYRVSVRATDAAGNAARTLVITKTVRS